LKHRLPDPLALYNIWGRGISHTSSPIHVEENPSPFKNDCISSIHIEYEIHVALIEDVAATYCDLVHNKSMLIRGWWFFSVGTGK